MKHKVQISEKRFLKNVNIRKALDEDENWEDFKNMSVMESDPIKFYKSGNTYFFQTAGFEYIWKK